MLLLCINQLNMFNNDNYWQLVHGRLMLTEGLYPTEEPLSMHEGWSFIYPQWLSIVIHTLIYDKLGLSALNVWYRIVQIIGVYFIYKLLKLHSDNKFANVFLTLMFFALYSNGLFSTRPFVISHTLMAIELYILEYYIKNKKPVVLAWLPLISVLWINFHNSLWLFGIILMLPMIAEWVLLKYRHNEPTFDIKPAFTSLAAYAAASLINPYGIDSILYLVRSKNTIKVATFIAELKAATINDYGVEVIVVLLFVLLGILLQKERKIAPIRYWFLFGGTFYLAMSHLRSCTAFFVCCIPLVSFYAGSVLPTFKSDILDKGMKIGLVIFLGAFSILSVSLYTPDKAESSLHDEEAITYLCENYSADVKIFNSINVGGELEYHGYKPYIDCRLEVFSKELNGKADVLQEWKDLKDGVVYPETVFGKYGFDVYFVEKDSMPVVYQYLLNNADLYELVCDTENTAIFEAVR